MVMGMDRHEAIEWLNAIKEKYIRGGDDYYDRQRRFAIDWAILLLAHDAVPVVRCKDCKHRRYHSCYLEADRIEELMAKEGIIFVHNAPTYSIRSLDDFCSCGERKDND